MGCNKRKTKTRSGDDKGRQKALGARGKGRALLCMERETADLEAHQKAPGKLWQGRQLNRKLGGTPPRQAQGSGAHRKAYGGLWNNSKCELMDSAGERRALGHIKLQMKGKANPLQPCEEHWGSPGSPRDPKTSERPWDQPPPPQTPWVPPSPGTVLRHVLLRKYIL